MIARRTISVGIVTVLAALAPPGAADPARGATQTPSAGRVDFNRDVRRILSENCFRCHGPDSKKSKPGAKILRLDLPDSAKGDLGDGLHAIIAGHPETSELIRRITTTDADDKMPPPDTGKKLTVTEIDTLRRWIAEGAEYSRHWSYIKPERSDPPPARPESWPRNPIDHFILSRLNREGLEPSTKADRPALIRRVSLDLTGLPPSLEDVDEFLADKTPGAYERLVDRLLAKDAFGEHWARLWLDQARYADSSGYSDDPARTIWAYRDYVIRSLNANKPFDQFTLEQIAGDLLDDPTDEQLVATAFHRNTMTNNEGGTNDEEYRNVAIVDRVNTTMAVWMGTTMACAQCHNHKYDPITQEEYFRMFAILNNTADADKGDESPVLPLFTPEQKRQRHEWQDQVARLERVVQTSTPALDTAQAAWEPRFQTELEWNPVKLLSARSQAGAQVHLEPDGTMRFDRGGTTDVYTVEIPVTADESISALRLDVLPDTKPPMRGVGHANGNFVVSRVLATVEATNRISVAGRFLRVELPGKEKILSLAEVQVFSGTSNIARLGEARQSSTAFSGPAKLAIDGNTDGDFAKAKSTTHTETSTDPWWELDLKSSRAVDRIAVWNRTDGSQDRLSGFRLALLDENRDVVWEQTVAAAPAPSAEFRPDGAQPVTFSFATADFSQKDFNATDILNNKDPKTRGWAIAPQFGEGHSLTLTLKAPVAVGAGSNLVLRIEQLSKYEFATIAQLRLMKSTDERASDFARVPAPVRAILQQPQAARSPEQRDEVRRFYLSMAPLLANERAELARLRKNLEQEKPYTTVPILHELAKGKRRDTHIQRRGNFLDLGAEVSGGLPTFGATQPGRTGETPDRLALARWLVDRNNPLTARVVANRLWESIFGIGLVRTSEEFGAQGELPSHPELLDWLAVELMDHHWDTKHLLRLMVTSAAYRQSSKVTPDLIAKDPDNRLLARGPRFRLSAEMIRDQALAVSGLLSRKMYGPPVKPPQPRMGLAAAFGSGTDWETSNGEDRYRRALYTTWRRSNPYPSMTTFDAPNREVCLVRRDRSNTPLQALVTLNDPVYVEAAQALARQIAVAGTTPEVKARFGFRRCTSRQPSSEELNGLMDLFTKSLTRFQADPAKAKDIATKPIGDAPKDSDLAELAAWTVVGNVLLNLDEMLMKR